MQASRHRMIGWVALVVLLLGAVYGLYRLFERLAELGPALEANQFLLPALSFALVVLVLGLAGVLIRNLVRLIVDRKRGIFGARLRSKLVFFFLALILAPAVILFSGSAQVIKQTVEAILRTPFEDLTRQSREIVDQWNEYFQTQSLRRAGAIAAEIVEGDYLDPSRSDELDQLVRRFSRGDEMQLVWVTAGRRVVARAGGLAGTPHEPLDSELEARVASLIDDVLRKGGPVTRIDYLGEGLLAHAAVPVGPPGSPEAAAGALVVAGIVVPTRLAINLEAVDAADRAYRQFRAQRRELVRLYLTLVGLIFVVILFVATWIGLYLSRRITVPIQELAAASREISTGNLGVRVRADVGDEMGVLVDAFNEMAAQLQENREVITRSTGDLRRSNRALDERRRYIETLLASLSTAVISLDPKGRVTTANPAVKEILGVEITAGDRAQRVFADSGLEPLSELLEQSLASGDQGIRRDLTINRLGEALHISSQISPLLGASGERLGTLVMVEDLTELLRAQKASAWREIARRIAHEIKNPLTPIQLSAQRLRKKFTEGATDLDSVLPAATASIEREVGALKRLVDEFSQFARMPEISPREVDFGKVVSSVLALYKGLPSVHWQVDVQPGLPPIVLDPEQMRRVLINLIDNAISAMDGRGRLTIAAAVHAGTHLRIEVADSGPGIPPEDTDKMFSPYFSTKKRGTGLGLAIVHRIVTDHRGSIRVEPNRPSGARFIIEIPA